MEESKAVEIAIQDVQNEMQDLVSEAFDKGIVAGKELMLLRMLALARLLIDSGDATPYLKDFITQIAKEEGFDVSGRHGALVRADVERPDQPSAGTGGDSGRAEVPEVREADRT